MQMKRSRRYGSHRDKSHDLYWLRTGHLRHGASEQAINMWHRLMGEPYHPYRKDLNAEGLRGYLRYVTKLKLWAAFDTVPFQRLIRLDRRA